MSDVADHPIIRKEFPVLSESLWRGASAQLRNMATIGGNLMQRTRCSYFREPAVYGACNKRDPGSGCAALEGVNRGHAVLGTSPSCIATNPATLQLLSLPSTPLFTSRMASHNVPFRSMTSSSCPATRPMLSTRSRPVS